MKSDIGECVYVLFHKLWGKTLVNGKLKSQAWWKKRLEDLINSPTITIPPENLWDGKPAEPAPIPFEIEMGYPDLDFETLLKAWKRMEAKRHA